MRNLFTLLVLLTSCEAPDKSTNPFLGSWYECDYIGQFNELHIFNDDLFFSFIVSSNHYDPRSYKIINDTLVYYDTLYNFHDERGNPIVQKFMGIVANDQLKIIWERVDSVIYKWHFQKMSQDLASPEKNNSDFQEYWQNEQFYKREEFFNCHDQRTEEQRRADSLKTEELIQDIL